MPAKAEDDGLAVVHVLGALRRSGVEVMFMTTSGQFEELGISQAAVAFADADDSEITAELVERGWDVTHVGSLGRVAGARALHRALRTSRPSVVVVHLEGNSLLLCLVARALRIPTVRSVVFAFGFTGWLRLRKTIERAVARAVGTVFVSVSQSVHVDELARLRNRTVVIENWFESGRFRPPSPADRATARRALGLHDDEPVVALVGNCSVMKQHDLLLRAVAAIPPDERPTVLHAGEGELTADEVLLAGHLGVGDRFRFLGSVPDIVPLLHAADGFVMPSKREGLSVASLEAAACGLPVVLTDVPGLRDLRWLSDSVVLVPEDPQSLTRALQRVLARASGGPDVDLATETARRFNPERGVAEYRALFHSMVDHRSRRRPRPIRGVARRGLRRRRARSAPGCLLRRRT